MGNILAYSGIVTKIRAMEAKLLSPKQFEEISAMKSVPEVAAYLMEKNPRMGRYWTGCRRKCSIAVILRSCCCCRFIRITRKSTVLAVRIRDVFSQALSEAV